MDAVESFAAIWFFDVICGCEDFWVVVAWHTWLIIHTFKTAGLKLNPQSIGMTINSLSFQNQNCQVDQTDQIRVFTEWPFVLNKILAILRNNFVGNFCASFAHEAEQLLRNIFPIVPHHTSHNLRNNHKKHKKQHFAQKLNPCVTKKS